MTASSQPRRPLPAKWLWLLWAAGIVLADVLTKEWALRSLVEGERHPVLGEWFGFQLVFNPGAAFSFGNDSTLAFTIISAAVVIALPIYTAKVHSRIWVVALAVVWAGAAGNFIDRLFRQPSFGQGHVVDFLAYKDWFVGNVADIALVVGIGLVVILSFWGPEPTTTPNEVTASEPGTDEPAVAQELGAAQEPAVAQETDTSREPDAPQEPEASQAVDG